MTQTTNDYTWRRVGTCGCEILDANGVVVAWAADDLWVAIIVYSLNTTGFSCAPPERIRFREIAGIAADRDVRRDMRRENLGFLAIGEPPVTAFRVAPA